MKAIVKMADQVAPSSATILITGESGTGKEVMSSYIHKKSPRKGKAFISINCAAIPENLLESELFGHEKGAFTGAIARRIGKFEEADGGTLLLDEVSEMHPSLQAKLLRAIQERVIDRVGGTKPIKVDIRLIATSNRDLQAAVRSGDFREDLYFRLNVMNLELPSLRNRPADILPLCQMFVDKYSEQNGLDKKDLSPASIVKLQSYPWPGNIRELENTMHRAVLLSEQAEIEDTAILLTEQNPAHVAATAVSSAVATASSVAQAAEAIDTQQSIPNNSTDMGNLVGQTVAHVERDLIISTVGHCLGNRTHAANILGISIRTLRNKLKQYNEQGIIVPK